ncbi:hypothetical protein [Nocardia sp. NBC_01329]|uniref:hypothetical protein n=1 Tax=Nocardia sp. NBC_01329 TaxID=2903594 RepID=UPI002E0F7495|nr:hypothetical protein OG405_23840 [Nocardia sp. NBC_01329]
MRMDPVGAYSLDAYTPPHAAAYITAMAELLPADADGRAGAGPERIVEELAGNRG